MSETKVGKTEQHPENTPDVIVELEKLQEARLKATAATELAAVGCRRVFLCLPEYMQKLRIDRETGDVIVLDDDGVVRRGVTATVAAREFRAKYVGKGDFFNA